MRIVGIDCGNEYTKAVVLEDGEIAGKAVVPTGFDIDLAARAACDGALADARMVDDGSVARVVVTGAGREAVTFADKVVSGMAAAAKGAHVTDEGVGLVIDLGAEGYSAITVKERGGVAHYECNDRCAAGSGTFVEAMARVLQLGIDEMDARAADHDRCLAIASQCVVFAESEVISLIHGNESVENIAFGVISGVASRVATVAKREGVRERVVLIGGLGRARTMVQCLSAELGVEVGAPDDAQYVSALGAASLHS